MSDWSVGIASTCREWHSASQEGRGRARFSLACGGTDHTHSRISSVLFQPEVYRWAGFSEREGKASRDGFFVCCLFFCWGKGWGREGRACRSIILSYFYFIITENICLVPKSNLQNKVHSETLDYILIPSLLFPFLPPH